MIPSLEQKICKMADNKSFTSTLFEFIFLVKNSSISEANLFQATPTYSIVFSPKVIQYGNIFDFMEDKPDAIEIPLFDIVYVKGII